MIKEVLQQLEPLDAQIDALCSRADDAEMASTTTHAAELAELSAEENTLLQRCTSLTPADRVFLARRPDRPHITEMIDNLFTDFFEQCGDRQCKEDAAILCGIARFHGMPVTVLGHRKGTTLEENLRCNFGMPGPEGYRKALRVMKHKYLRAFKGESHTFGESAEFSSFLGNIFDSVLEGNFTAGRFAAWQCRRNIGVAIESCNFFSKVCCAQKILSECRDNHDISVSIVFKFQ